MTGFSAGQILIDKIKKIAKEEDRSQSYIIRRAVLTELKRLEKERKSEST